ncbi:MAG TPA: prephenate dehydrogenase/arogenate dehydrogenase family protein [Candidatus Obscuribacterales bacterium]
MEDAGWRVSPEATATQQINEMRKAIDELDYAIAALLAQRLSLAGQIGAVKADSAIGVKDNSRERTVLDNVRTAAGNPDVAQALANIYGCVLSESCKLQEKLKDAGDSTVDRSGGRKPAAAGEPAALLRTGTQPAQIASTVYFPRVLIVGLGMIGGSMARQIKRKMPDAVISAIDIPKVLETATIEGLIDEPATDLVRAVSKAGLILLCASPSENMQLLEQIAPMTKRRQIVMDVTSTKQEICQLAERIPMKADFVGGHPLFGSHKSGVEAVRDVDVDGKRFCLVPTNRSSELTLRRLARWLTDLGLRVVQSSAQEHDAALARTSHQVQLLAIALGNAMARGRSPQELRTMLALSGPSLRSLARLMSSPPDMWVDITAQNKDEIQSALTELIEELRGVRTDISLDDLSALRTRFQEAATLSSLMDTES